MEPFGRALFHSLSGFTRHMSSYNRGGLGQEVREDHSRKTRSRSHTQGTQTKSAMLSARRGQSNPFADDPFGHGRMTEMPARELWAPRGDDDPFARRSRAMDDKEAWRRNSQHRRDPDKEQAANAKRGKSTLATDDPFGSSDNPPHEASAPTATILTAKRGRLNFPADQCEKLLSRMPGSGLAVSVLKTQILPQPLPTGTFSLSPARSRCRWTIFANTSIN